MAPMIRQMSKLVPPMSVTIALSCSNKFAKTIPAEGPAAGPENIAATGIARMKSHAGQSAIRLQVANFPVVARRPQIAFEGILMRRERFRDIRIDYGRAHALVFA